MRHHQAAARPSARGGGAAPTVLMPRSTSKMGSELIILAQKSGHPGRSRRSVVDPSPRRRCCSAKSAGIVRLPAAAGASERTLWRTRKTLTMLNRPVLPSGRDWHFWHKGLSARQPARQKR